MYLSSKRIKGKKRNKTERSSSEGMHIQTIHNSRRSIAIPVGHIKPSARVRSIEPCGACPSTHIYLKIEKVIIIDPELGLASLIHFDRRGEQSESPSYRLALHPMKGQLKYRMVIHYAPSRQCPFVGPICHKPVLLLSEYEIRRECSLRIILKTKRPMMIPSVIQMRLKPRMSFVQHRLTPAP